MQVISDFQAQLAEDMRQHAAALQREAEERARAQARLEAQVRRWAEGVTMNGIDMSIVNCDGIRLIVA